MNEGTKSYLFGCHQFLMHPLQVIRAWRMEYGTWPEWWQIIGIFLHDIGVCGRQYLSDDKAKIGHWKRGAHLARDIVRFICLKLKYSDSKRAIIVVSTFYLCAGHCPEESGFDESKLSRADKRSWVIAPMWWLWSNYYIEWHGKVIGVTPPPVWKALVAENLKRQKPLGNHELYLKNRRAI